MPDNDPFLPAAEWTAIARSYRVGIHQEFEDVSCCECQMDIEMTARARRFYRKDPLGDGWFGWDGKKIGDQNDPRNFASLLLVKVCYTDIKCDGENKPDFDELHSHLFYTDGLGTYIQYPPRGMRSNADRFMASDPCNVGLDFINFLIRVTQTGDGMTPGGSEF